MDNASDKTAYRTDATSDPPPPAPFASDPAAASLPQQTPGWYPYPAAPTSGPAMGWAQQTGPTWAPSGPVWPPSDGSPPPPYLPYSFPPAVVSPQKSTRPRNAGIAAAALLIVAVAVAGVLILTGRTSPAASNSNNLAVSGPKTASTPAGYTSFVDSADRFSIAVPSSWTEVNPESAGSIAAFEQVEQNNPNLKAIIGSPSSLEAKGMRFLAIDTADQESQPSTINVTAQADPGFQDSEFSQLVAQLPAEFSKFGATMLGSSTVSLPGGEALRVSLDLPLTDDLGNRTTLAETQYYLGSNDFIYVITGTGPGLTTIASTFRTQ